VDLVVTSTRDKLAAITTAQEQGRGPALWFSVTPELGTLTRPR
jgi:hypothetical protein